LPDNRHFEFDLSWDDLDGLVGVYQPRPFGIDPNLKFDTKRSNGRERNWYFDATPFDHSEFGFSSKFYGDYDATERADWFNGNPPDQLEVGYIGTRAPGSAIGSNQRDLLSTALHEIGHMIGINYTGGGDTDYDFAPHVAGGARVGANETDGGLFGGGHLKASPALLSGGGRAPAVRQLPSATDILAMYDEGGYRFYDLPRVNFIGGNNALWNSTRTWIGGHAPNINQEVFINHGGRVRILNNTVVSAKRLVLGDGELVGNNVTLNVQDDAEISGDVSFSGRLRVGGKLLNNGRIAPRRSGVLTLETKSNKPVWDLGSGNGTVDALEGDLVVNGRHQQPYSSDLLIGPNHYVSFNEPLTLDRPSFLELRGRRPSGGRAPATLGGEGVITAEGRVVVDGTGVISAPLKTRRGSFFQIPDVGDRLQLENPNTSLGGGRFVGEGVLSLVEGANVTAATTVDVTTFDWGGPNEGAVTAIQRRGSLTIASDQLEQTFDGYDGKVTLRGGRLNMKTGQPWKLEGRMNLHELARVTGDEMVVAQGGVVEIREATYKPGPFDVGLQLSKGGKGSTDEIISLAVIDAPQRFETGGVLRALRKRGGPLVIKKGETQGNPKQSTALEHVALRGKTTLAGGSIQGPLNVFQMGNLNVESDSRINITGDYYLDGITRRQTTTIEPGVTLNLRVGEMKSFTRQPAMIIVQRDAKLNVQDINDPAWTLDKELQLKRGSTLSGDDLEISSQGFLTGVGTLQALDLLNAGTVAPGDRFGDLTIDGDYAQTDSGEIMFQLGGSSNGSRYDQLLADRLDLAGTISIELLSGFIPSIGERFELLRADTISGLFSNLDLLAPTGVPFNGRLLYEESAVVFEVLAGSTVRRSGIAAVPEPTGYTLILFGMALFAAVRCRLPLTSV